MLSDSQPLRALRYAARAVVDYLDAECVTFSPASQRCALVRFYKTREYSQLDAARQAFTRRLLAGTDPWPEMKCLTLLATRGEEPEWCDPKQSVGHQAVPLASVRMVEQAPMISQLIREMGLDVGDVLAPDPTFLARAGREDVQRLSRTCRAGEPIHTCSGRIRR